MERYKELDRLLEFLERTIEPEHLDAVMRLQYDAINYRDIDRLPLTLTMDECEFAPLPIHEAHYNPELLLYNELLSSTGTSCYSSAVLRDDNPLMVRANYGIIILASLFGCETTLFNDQLPWVSHLDFETAKKALQNCVPDLNGGYGKKVLETYEFFAERLQPYPKCSKYIHLTQPDLQGPFDVLHQVVGDEVFYLVLDDPELLHQMLSNITDTYIAFRKKVDGYLNDKGEFEDACFVHGYTVGGQVLIKADTAMANLSREMFETFELPYVKKIFNAFASKGGGSLHSCGLIRPEQCEMLLDSVGAFNYGNPEKHDIHEHYSIWQQNNVPIIGWGYNDYYEDYHKNANLDSIKTGLTLIAKVKTMAQAKDLLNRYRT